MNMQIFCMVCLQVMVWSWELHDADLFLWLYFLTCYRIMWKKGSSMTLLTSNCGERQLEWCVSRICWVRAYVWHLPFCILIVPWRNILSFPSTFTCIANLWFFVSAGTCMEYDIASALHCEVGKLHWSQFSRRGCFNRYSLFYLSLFCFAEVVFL